MNIIAYQGIVTLKFKDRPVCTVHNSGTNVLFSTLSKLLTTVVLNDYKVLPTYMSLVYSSEDVLTNENYENYENDALIISPVQIISREVDTESNENNGCVFTALLHNSLLKSSFKDLSDESTCKILLLNGAKQILAYAQIKKSDLTDLSNSNAQVAIEWTMTFSNTETTNGGSL